MSDRIIDCRISDRIRIVTEDATVEVSASDVVRAIKRIAPTPKATELAELVKDMRHWQNAYFRTREAYPLEVAKSKEKKVDEAVDAILSPQKKLFRD